MTALVVAAVAAAVIGIVPLVPSIAAPATLVRSIHVDASSLVPQSRRPAIGLTSGDALRTVHSARTSTVRTCAPMWFDGVALTWRGSAGRAVTTSVSASADGTTFGRDVAVDEEGGPDPGTPEYRAALHGSTYVWTGGARCVRFSMDLPSDATVSDVRVLFINSSGSEDGPGSGPRDIGPVAIGAPSGPLAPPSAEAMTGRPHIITRAQWGADPKLMNCTPLVADFLKVAFVHHTAGSNSYTRSQADDVVRGIYAYHTNGRGWCDIGYNFLVDRFGDVFEGRSGGIMNDVIGAAQMGFNTGAFSVSVMGTFDTYRPPAATVSALERVLAWRLDVAHVNPSSTNVMTSAGGDTTRYPAGARVRLRDISGHRDTGITDCPGTILYAMLPAIRARVATMGLPKMYNPRLSTTRIVSGQPVNLRIVARGSRTLRWTVSVFDPAGARFAAFPVQRGDVLDLLWSAAGPPAQPDVPGAYTVAIAARGPHGTVARAARLTLTVEPLPSPSPSSSPSPTPSPTASPSA